MSLQIDPNRFNPLARGEGQSETTSNQPVNIGVFGEHKVDLGATGNWTLRKMFDSVVGLVAKPWRNLTSFFGWSSNKQGEDGSKIRYSLKNDTRDSGLNENPLYTGNRVVSGSTSNTKEGTERSSQSSASGSDFIEEEIESAKKFNENRQPVISNDIKVRIPASGGRPNSDNIEAHGSDNEIFGRKVELRKQNRDTLFNDPVRSEQEISHAEQQDAAIRRFEQARENYNNFHSTGASLPDEKLLEKYEQNKQNAKNEFNKALADLEKFDLTYDSNTGEVSKKN